jgi:hypothetical protein
MKTEPRPNEPRTKYAVDQKRNDERRGDEYDDASDAVQ